MRVSKKVRKYFRKRNHNIQLLLKKPEKKFTVSDFHELRVEIKKIKALLKFVNYCDTDFKRKNFFKPYKNLFTKAGKVRELQLEEKELKKNDRSGSLKEYRDYLRKSRFSRKKYFFEKITAGRKKQIENSLAKIAPFFSEAGKKNAENYFERKEKKISKLTGKKELKEKNLHALRKDLKEISYTRRMLDKNLPEKKLNSSEKFQELLGQWHDKEVMTAHLDKVISDKKIKETELSRLKRIRQKNSESGKELLKKINRLLHNNQGKVMA